MTKLLLSRLFLTSGALLALASCSTGGTTAAENAGFAASDVGELQISKSTPLEFEATYTLPTGEWARVHRIMGMTATKMFLESSSGTVYINDGLGLSDPSHPAGKSEVEPGSTDDALLHGMLAAFLRAGVHVSPGEKEIGTPQYAAAYCVVEALGIKKTRLAFGDTHNEAAEEAPTVFPYAGWLREDLIPKEAREAQTAIGGAQNGTGVCASAPVSPCCGDLVCGGCDPNDQPGGCAPSCAAGDYCNKYLAGSGCGTINCGSATAGTVCGTAGDNFCPHTCGDRGGSNGGLAQYQNNVCNTSRLQSETSYCYYHTPSEGHNYNCQAWNCGVLFGGQQLAQGQSLSSCDGRFSLTMQTDGNAVLYQGGTSLWSSHTNGKGGQTLRMQTDGNLVVYNGSNVALWSTQTQGHNGSWTRVQEDGNMDIYYPSANSTLPYIWSSNTCCH